jgi:hypothetical protein
MHLTSWRRHLASILSVAFIFVGAVSGAATAGAATAKTRPAGPRESATGGQLQFTDYSDSDGPRSMVVLTGVIGDYGTAVRQDSNGGAGRLYNQLHLDLTRGSFVLNIARLENALVTAFRFFPSNTSTCSGVVTSTGESPIVAGSGTGAYKGIGGELKLTTTVHEVDSWPKCAVLLSESIVIAGSGTVNLR